MNSKSIIGCHFANSYESKITNGLIYDKKIQTFVSNIYNFEETNKALEKFVENSGYGKIVIGILSDKKNNDFKSNLIEVEDE